MDNNKPNQRQNNKDTRQQAYHLLHQLENIIKCITANIDGTNIYQAKAEDLLKLIACRAESTTNMISQEINTLHKKYATCKAPLLKIKHITAQCNSSDSNSNNFNEFYNNKIGHLKKVVSKAQSLANENINNAISNLVAHIKENVISNVNNQLFDNQEQHTCEIKKFSFGLYNIEKLIQTEEVKTIKEKIKDNTKNDCFYLHGLDISTLLSEQPERSLTILSQLLESLMCSKVCIREMKGDEENVAYIMNRLLLSCKIHSITIEDSIIPNITGWVNTLKNSNVSTIRFNSCIIVQFISKQFSDFFSIMSSNFHGLTSISMNNCGVRDEYSVYIRDALGKNNSLRELYLCNNYFTSNGCKQILDGLVKNKMLEKICFKGNNVFDSTNKI
jgi:hypothetical protein